MKKKFTAVDAPIIILAGMEFEQKKSDGEIYAAGRAVLADCLRLDVSDECAVLNILQNLCGFIDETLGAGSVKKIVGETPVSLPMALKILNEIIRTCGERYAAYIRGEYLGGGHDTMKRFSLSSLDSLPESVCEGGAEYAVNTDFHTILRIFRMLGDPEITNEDRPWLLRRMFFPGKVPARADEHFEWFVSCGREKGEPGGKRDFDYEQDAAEIYSAFRQAYGIDLINERLHWWRFLPLLEGLFCCENALSSKVRIRHSQDSEGQRKADQERQRRAVELKETISRTDAALEEEIRQRLISGQPIGDLLNTK